MISGTPVSPIYGTIIGMSKKKSSSLVPILIFFVVIGVGVFTLVASFAATPGSETSITPQDLQQPSALQQSVIDSATNLSTN